MHKDGPDLSTLMARSWSASSILQLSTCSVQWWQKKSSVFRLCLRTGTSMVWIQRAPRSSYLNHSDQWTTPTQTDNKLHVVYNTSDNKHSVTSCVIPSALVQLKQVVDSCGYVNMFAPCTIMCLSFKNFDYCNQNAVIKIPKAQAHMLICSHTAKTCVPLVLYVLELSEIWRLQRQAANPRLWFAEALSIYSTTSFRAFGQWPTPKMRVFQNTEHLFGEEFFEY